jgi:hypothetical protein
VLIAHGSRTLVEPDPRPSSLSIDELFTGTRRAALVNNTGILSDVERRQLDSVRLRLDGTPSAHQWPSAVLWSQIRSYLVERSLKANPALDTDLTAYTPGETLRLLEHPVVQSWHRRAVAKLDNGYSRVVFVPCAKTKPWAGPSVNRSRLYSAYNVLRPELPDTCFVTISEPLGVVPMGSWTDFPQYDNPGLFADDTQRSGMTTKEWLASPFGKCYGIPFDESAANAAIRRLGAVVAEFMKNNRGVEFVSVVDNRDGTHGTHANMLTIAVALTGIEVERYPKRAEARVDPLPYLMKILGKASKVGD